MVITTVANNICVVQASVSTKKVMKVMKQRERERKRRRWSTIKEKGKKKKKKTEGEKKGMKTCVRKKKEISKEETNKGEREEKTDRLQEGKIDG